MDATPGPKPDNETTPHDPRVLPDQPEETVTEKTVPGKDKSTAPEPRDA